MPDKFNSTTRFSDRVDNYIKYRPSYPIKVIQYLLEKQILTSTSVVADIGSGTGLSAELFLKNGNTVIGIEPNDEMRAAGEKLLANYPNFKSIKASAEQTTLPNGSVDLVIAGQAFHWFDIAKARVEIQRILKPGGYCALIWNDRKIGEAGFLKEYDDLILRFSKDYKEVNHQNIDASSFDLFFGKGRWAMEQFYNEQVFDLGGLKGRLNSSSYAPAEGTPNHLPMMEALQKLFDKYQKNNKVVIEYETKIYFGKILPAVW